MEELEDLHEDFITETVEKHCLVPANVLAEATRIHTKLIDIYCYRLRELGKDDIYLRSLFECIGQFLKSLQGKVEGDSGHVAKFMEAVEMTLVVLETSLIIDAEVFGTLVVNYTQLWNETPAWSWYWQIYLIVAN